MTNEEYRKVEESLETIEKSIEVAEWDEREEVKDCLKKLIEKIEDKNDE